MEYMLSSCKSDYTTGISSRRCLSCFNHTIL